MSTNPSHSAMLMVSSLEPRTHKFVGEGPTLLHLHLGLTAQSVTNGVRWTSIHESPTLSWSSHCRSNTPTTRAILNNYAFTLGQCPWRPCRSTSGGWGHTTSPLEAFRTFGRAPSPPSRNLLSLYQELGPRKHFPLADGASSPQQL
jgi:hypothetical protein